MATEIVCVLDMDETLGWFDEKRFHVRPKCYTLINFLRILKCDIILWSLGSNEYVERVTESTLTDIYEHAFKIYGRSKCKWAYETYHYYKFSKVIRDLYKQPVFLIGVDDKVSQNMDPGYDLRINVSPYTKTNSHDKELLDVVEKMTNALVERKPLVVSPLILDDPLDDEEELMKDINW